MAELLRDGDTDESHGAWLRRAWLAEEARRSIESEPSTVLYCTGTMKRSVTPIIHKVSARTPANECSPSFLQFLIFDFGGSHTESDTIHRLEVQLTLFHYRVEFLVRIKTTSAW